MKNIGIYKITSPSGKIYIGQSIHIKQRWKQYVNPNSSSVGPKLLNSLNKHSWEKHNKEILEECLLEQLNEREIFYKQQFINEFGWSKALFCEIYDSGGGPKSEETKLKQSKGLKKSYDDGKKKPYWLGKKNTKLSDYHNNHDSGFKYKRTQNHKDKLSEMMKKIWEDPITKKQIGNKISKSKTGHLYSEITKSRMSKSHNKIILQYDKQGNFIKEWNSITEASKSLNTSLGNISLALNKKSKTAKGFIWYYKKDFLS